MAQEFNPVRELYSHDDQSDAWGFTMNALFDIAEELHRRGEICPDAWGFIPSPLHHVNGPVPAEFPACELCLHDSSYLLEYGEELNARAGELRAAGEDY